jgi:hypothetical protein
VIITDRSGWGALPPENPPTPWNVSALDGICQHWFGSPRAALTHAGCDDLLRSVQRSHQAGEYNDIAYNFGVCPHGVAYELRGWNVRTGANGTTDANSRFIAFVYMAGTGDPLTVKGKETLTALYAEAFSKGVAEHAIRHGDITGSECPGPALRAWLASGDWKPKPPPVPAVKVQFMLFDGEGKKLDESAPVLKGGKAEETRLGSFLVKVRPTLLAELRSDRDAVIRRRRVDA